MKRLSNRLRLEPCPWLLQAARTSRSSRPPLAVGLAIMILGHAAAAAGEQGPLVSISGGVDLIGHNYHWQVTNHYQSPIGYVEFPHYQADLFMSPDGWSSQSTYLVNVGVPDRPGTCVATPDSPGHAIRQGGSADFRMRIAARGAPHGPGNVKIRFEDGTETIVAGVELPYAPDKGFEHYPLVTVGAIFVGWVLWREIRRPRQATASHDQPGEDL